jgi:hypothetical protein
MGKEVEHRSTTLTPQPRIQHSFSEVVPESQSAPNLSQPQSSRRAAALALPSPDICSAALISATQAPLLCFFLHSTLASHPQPHRIPQLPS